MLRLTDIKIPFFKKIFFKSSFILREIESEWGREQRVREKEREKTPSKLCTVSAEPNVGLELTNHEIMT